MKLISSFIGIMGLCAIAVGADEMAVLRWDVELSRPASMPIELVRGETLKLKPRLLSNSEPVNLSNCTAVVLRYRSAEMTNYYVVTGSVDKASSRICVTWSPACEAPATNYAFTLAAVMPTGSTLRVFGKIKLLGSIGTGEPVSPPRVYSIIDWAAIENLNLDAAPFGAGGSAGAGSGVAAGTWRNPQWFSLDWSENPTNAPDFISYRTNLDQTIERQAFNNVKHDRVAQITEQHSFFELAFAVSPTNLASVSSNGYLTHLVDGVVTVSVSAASFGLTNMLALRTAGATAERYLTGAAGSLRAASIAAVDAAVTGATMQIFSSYDPDTANFVRSTNLWLRPAPECLAAWNSRSVTRGGGVLITPRHAVTAIHASFRPQPGDTVSWVTASNSVFSAIVVAEKNIAADIALIRLDRELTGVRRAKFIAAPNAFMPTGISEIPLACGEIHGSGQKMQLVIGGSRSWGERGWTGIGWRKSPERPDWRGLFYHYPAIGDSSQPVMLTTGNDLVILFCLYYPTQGPDLHAYLSEIQAGIAAWGDTNLIEYLDTQSYTEF